jgi:hypothetical protein
VMIKDYTIDYEEYWNRQQVWCIKSNDSARNYTGHCSMMTYYGNKNLITGDNDRIEFYYCSTLIKVDWEPLSIEDNLNDHKDCANEMNVISSSWFIQSYGQYAKMFIDVKDDVDYITWAVKDDDDTDLWDGPNALDNSIPQELYLISHDKQRRLLLRRKLISSWDLNNDGLITDSERLYSLQVLQLRWFDAGVKHTFDITNDGVYDGIIDTWACDYSLWFVCTGASVSWAYTDFRLPIDSDDWRKDLLTNDITISERNIELSPTIDPYLSWGKNASQTAPFIRLSFTAKLYGKNWNLKIPRSQMDMFNIKLQTSFSFTNSWSR